MRLLVMLTTVMMTVEWSTSSDDANDRIDEFLHSAARHQCDRQRRLHTLVIELALTSGSRVGDDVNYETDRIALQTITNWPANALLLVNSSDFNRIAPALRTELTFSPHSHSSKINQIESASVGKDEESGGGLEERVFLLLSLGCAPFDRSASASASARLATSLGAVDKLVDRGVICRSLQRPNRQCSIVRYFAASHRLLPKQQSPAYYQSDKEQELRNLEEGRRKRSIDITADLDLGLYDYNEENDSLAESSGSLPDSAMTEKQTSTSPARPAFDKGAPNPPPTSTTTAAATTTTTTSTTTRPVTEPQTTTTENIVENLGPVRRLWIEESRKLSVLQLTAGIPPVYPSLEGLFLVGDGPGGEPDVVVEPGRLAYSLTTVACFGTGGSCQQQRHWLTVCGDALCGQPQSDSIGFWQLRLDAWLREEPNILTSNSFTVIVAPRPVPSESPADADDKEDEFPPSLRLVRHIRRIEAVVGELLTFQFPADMFMEMSNTGMKSDVTYVVVNGTTRTGFRRDSWVQFDESTRTLHALPLSDEHIGSHAFILVATVNSNSAQSAVSECAFNVTVSPQPYASRITHHFVAIFNVSQSSFRAGAPHALTLFRSIASYFGDAEAQKLAVTFLQPVGQLDVDPTAAGGYGGRGTGADYGTPRVDRRARQLLLFAWSNKSLCQPQVETDMLPWLPVLGEPVRPSRVMPYPAEGPAIVDSPTTMDGCPITAIRSLLHRMLDPTKPDLLNPRFVNRFADQTLLSIKLVGSGPCRSTIPAANLFVAASAQAAAGGSFSALSARRNDNEALIRAMIDDRATQMIGVTEPAAESPTAAAAAGSLRYPLDGNELLITIVIPSIVIALALVLSALIACVLYQKMRQSNRRRCRATATATAGGRGRVSVKKGVPVIFAEELDDRIAASHDTPSRPLILPADLIDARGLPPNTHIAITACR